MVFQNNTQIAGKVSWQFFKQMDIYYLRFSNILFKAVQKCSIFKIHMLRKSSMQKKLAKVHRLNSILQTKLLMVNYHADKFLEAYLESCQTSTKEILRKWLTKKAVNYFGKKGPSWMFDRNLTSSLWVLCPSCISNINLLNASVALI